MYITDVSSKRAGYFRMSDNFHYQSLYQVNGPLSVNKCTDYSGYYHRYIYITYNFRPYCEIAL